MTTEYTPNFQLAMPDFRSGPWHDLVNNDFARIDALMYSAMSQGNVIPWANNTHYEVGTTVVDNTDASIWMCAITHTSAVSPTTFLSDRTAHPTYWARLLTGFAPRGEWARSTQYFPYDLAYDSGRGIMALCQIKHVSTPTGSIIDDKAYWVFLLDMSGVATVIASAVTYSNTASSIPATNVQNAIDYVQTEVVSLNNVNVAQGASITNLGTVNNTQDSSIAALQTRMTAVENKNTSQDAAIAGIPREVPAGASMLFYNAAAPTGWTKLTGANDFAIRVVSGAGGGAGGSYGFSFVFGQSTTQGTTLDVNSSAYHYHLGIPADSGYATGPYVYIGPGNIDYIYGQTNTAAWGNSGAHSHPVYTQVLYLDMIICVKS